MLINDVIDEGNNNIIKNHTRKGKKKSTKATLWQKNFGGR